MLNSLNPTIRPLSLDVVHRMAAGEVIDSVAAVVRELVENAIDAHATRIVVSLWLDQWKIHVTDNGDGIVVENLKTIALPHTTHKISNQSDLSNIKTLGFRGEALHSIAQFSQLEILSCIPDFPGWSAAYNSEGEIVKLEETAIAPGTIIRVNQLFQNWESRREIQSKQYLKQQIKQIQTCIHNISIAHPNITLQVFQDDREWITLGNTKDLIQRLLQVLPSGSVSDFSVVQTEKIELVLGLPDRISRRSPDWIRIAINGRIIQIPELLQTVVGSLRKMLPRDRYPIALIHLHAPPEQVDWNRDPAKSSLYLQELKDWQTLIEQTVQEALKFAPDLQSGERTTQFLRAAEQSAGYSIDRSINPQETQRFIPGTLKVIAQVSNRYILAEHPAGMYLIEQHVAHERVLYEQICDRWQIVPLDSSEPSIILNDLSSRQVEQLESIGLTLDEFGDRLWAVRTLPEMLLKRDDRVEALIELSLGSDLQTAQVSIACRTAIRNGIPLEPSQQRELLQQWQQTRNPHTCPHGRPIYLSLQETSLAQFFRRQWVIGKSHGLED